MQGRLLITAGFVAVLAILAWFNSSNLLSAVWVVLLAWCALWLGIWQALRLRVSAEGQPQAKPEQPALKFWAWRVMALLLTMGVGLGVYTNYLTTTYQLPPVYQWRAALWVLGINTPMPELVDIPAGSFAMGSEDGGIRGNDKPVHNVTIAKPFKLGKYEVTFAEYDYYLWQIRQQGLDKGKPSAQGWGRDRRPVINVSWQEAQGYVNWLSQTNKQGLNCRLPSEAEWEYAIRANASTKTKYYWGDKPNRDYANYGKEECCDGLAEGNDKWVNTAPVGSLKPNKWGLYDMSGNVFEWVQDTYHSSYEGAPNDGTAWESVDDDGSSYWVLRGGSWYNASYGVRSAVRYYVFRGSYDVGFRIFCSLH